MHSFGGLIYHDLYLSLDPFLLQGVLRSIDDSWLNAQKNHKNCYFVNYNCTVGGGEMRTMPMKPISCTIFLPQIMQDQTNFRNMSSSVSCYTCNPHPEILHLPRWITSYMMCTHETILSTKPSDYDHIMNAARFELTTFGFGIQCSTNWAKHPQSLTLSSYFSFIFLFSLLLSSSSLLFLNYLAHKVRYYLHQMTRRFYPTSQRNEWISVF